MTINSVNNSDFLNLSNICFGFRKLIFYKNSNFFLNVQHILKKIKQNIIFT